MSCGKHHDTDCSEVLERMFFFIDNELQNADRSVIETHLDECGPCLAKYDLERTVKALVSAPAPSTPRRGCGTRSCCGSARCRSRSTHRD